MVDVVLRDGSGDTFAEYDVTTLAALRADERGQGLAEYGIVLGLIAILCIAAVVFLSGNLQGMLNNVGSSI